MKRRSFLKGLLGIGAVVTVSGCMRPPEAKVSPARLDCETAMIDAPGCMDTEDVLVSSEITATEVMDRQLTFSEEVIKQFKEASTLLDNAVAPTKGRILSRNGYIYRG